MPWARQDRAFLHCSDNETEERVARLVCIDQSPDLAVRRVQGSNLPFINLKHAVQAKPRELSLAFGNPFGMDRTVTMGILSAVNRRTARMPRGCHFSLGKCAHQSLQCRRTAV